MKGTAVLAIFLATLVAVHAYNQSYACSAPGLDHPSPTSMPVMAPAFLGNITSEGTLSAASIKFLYNLAWGPPNMYLINSITNFDGSLINGVAPSFAANTLYWTAYISTNAANGFPFGCCGGVGQVQVMELGCQNCIATGALPGTLSSVPYTVSSMQRVSCNIPALGSASSSTVACSQSPYLPGSTDAATLPNTDVITTGTGVTTLMFPSQTNSVLAAGVYRFQLWAESICGYVASPTVSLAARCPPSPTVSAILRQVTGATTTTGGVTTSLTNSIALSANGGYQVPVGSQAFVDASCSFPFSTLKQSPFATWPATQATNPASPLGYIPTQNLYAIQKVYFSVANPAMTQINSATTVTSDAEANGVLDQWGATVTFLSSGTHTIVITATDGCSAGQATITVVATCSCVPVAKALYVPTLWSNEPLVAPTGFTNPTNQMFNDADQPTASALGAQTFNTDMVGVPSPLYTYTLTGSAYDYEVPNFNTILAYDWNFVYWVPDYSVSFTQNGMPVMSLAAAYLPSTPAIAGGNFPPSMGSSCSPNGVIPLACANGLFGLTGSTSGANPCCFSAMNDITTNVATVVRPTVTGTYVYKVLQVVTNPAQALRQFTSGNRIKVYNFMRISPTCNTALGVSSPWMSNISSVANGNPVNTYYALPTYLQYNSASQMGSTQNYADFNGFPNVNTGSTGSANNQWHPNTECGAWLKTMNQQYSYTDNQVMYNQTVTCGKNNDLVLCRVSIAQTGSFTSNTAQLSVSSFGSCKGLWQFSLTVSDTCSNSTDYFDLQVGCNRAPVVSAGCSNTQTWVTIAGAPQFDQITLDGRASFDPDNFGDTFDQIPAPGDTFPGCTTATTAGGVNCNNGGLGARGLTYAWALLTFYSATGQLMYSSTNTNASCPIPSMNVACTQSYCSGTYFYPTVNPLNGIYNSASLTTAATAYGPSAQGTLTLGAVNGVPATSAWQMGFYTVNTVTSASGNSTYNTMPTLDPSGTSMTMQMIFPDFNPSCAPTVMPMFFSGTLAANAGGVSMFPFVGGATTYDWNYAQQIKHVGNVAYIGGLQQAGTYRARLYAFDGCSVGSADVYFVLQCPNLVINAPNWGLLPQYLSGNASITYTLPSIIVNYGGTQDIPVSGTVAVLPSVNGVPVTGAVGVSVAGVGACSLTSPNSLATRTLTPPAGAITTNCASLIYSSAGAGAWLPQGNYVIAVTVSDACNRGMTSIIYSPQFQVVCPTLTLASLSPITLGTSPYTLPNPTVGSFANMMYNIQANTSSSAATITVSYQVYWRPQSALTTGSTPSGVSSQFLGNVAGVYPVYASVNTGVVPTASTPITIPGGTRTIQFGTGVTTTSTAYTLAARTATDPGGAGLIYNTAANSGQQLFTLSTTRSTFAILWAGDYYVNFFATSSCSTSASGTPAASPADQIFIATCTPAADPFLFYNVTVTASQWVTGSGAVFTNLPYVYFGNAPFQLNNGNYCPGSYCATGTTLSNGIFRTMSLTSNAAPTGMFITNGAASSVSFRISYRNPLSMADSVGAAPGGTAPASLSSTVFSVYNQNPLLLSPFSYLNLGTTAVASTTRAWFGNAAPQNVQLNIPGTWTIDMFNTNGCANTTSARNFDLTAYCYDSTLPEANFVYTVYTRLVPQSLCPTTFDTTNNRCNVTSTAVSLCPSVTIVRGPYGPAAGSAFTRRRLDKDSAQEPIPAASQAKPNSRSLLQTLAICTSTSATISGSFTSPATGSAAPTFSGSSTPALSPNFGAQVNIFYNSFDINPGYYPSTTDVRNYYDQGDIFNDGQIVFGTSAYGFNKKNYQGAFDALTVAVDPTQSTLRSPANPFANNVVVTWNLLPSWSTTYTGSAVTFAPTSTSTSGFPSSYAPQCSWAPLNTLYPSSSTAGNAGGAAYNGGVDQPMLLQGCNPIPLGNTIAASTIPAGGTMNGVGVIPATSSAANQLIVSQLGLSSAYGVSATTTPLPSLVQQAQNLFTMLSTAPPTGRATTYAGNYDFVAMAWNGPVGLSCYDYRAVRVVAICNRLVPYDFTSATATTFRSSATEGPTIITNLLSNPSGLSTIPPSTASPPVINVGWLTGTYDSVNITAGFKYLQCGSNTGTPPAGGTDPSGVVCGFAPGSADGEGNYYSLVYRWNVISSPNASVFSVNTINSAINGYTFGTPFQINTTTVASGNANITTTYYGRANTYTSNTITRQIVLLNHGYKYPMTTFVPDVAGSYSIQLTIDDGCSTWSSSVVSISAACSDLTLKGSVTFASTVTVRTPGATWTPSASPVAGVPPGATVYYINIDGSQYVRVSMMAALPTISGATPPAYNSYLTYMWTVTSMTNTPAQGANVSVPVTNMQGISASFVPTDYTLTAATLSPLVFQVNLVLQSNCVQGDGSLQSLTLTAYIVVNCTINFVGPSNFIFRVPYVNSMYTGTSSPALQQFWGFSQTQNPTASPSSSSNFLSTQSLTNTAPATIYNNPTNLYYRSNMILKTAITSSPGTPIVCDPTGPYCAPDPSNPGSFIPTILFGGSVPQAPTATPYSPDNTNYAKINNVWGAAWQGLYFSVPVQLTPNLCKIKQTYWVLINYQNSLPFIPVYVPTTTAPAPTCTPSQMWSWTVVATPCQTCSSCADGSTTCANYNADVCDFQPNYLYTYKTYTSTITGAVNRINTGYNPPNFFFIGTSLNGPSGTLSAGNNLNPYCVYDATQRLSAMPGYNNLMQNCRYSGRGLSVDIATGAATSCAASQSGNGIGANGQQSIMCPMSSIAFVPGFPGAYTLQLNVVDSCSAPVAQQVTINAQCRLNPVVTVMNTAITSYYDCGDPSVNSAWGNANVASSTPLAGKFDPITLSSLIPATNIAAANNSNQALPTVRAVACSVILPTTPLNCSGVMALVNSQPNIAVTTTDGTNNYFKACCTCLYGTQTINLYGSSTGGSHTTPAPNPNSPSIGPTTQSNNLALDDSLYERNSIILIALVTPMAVILVGSLAGNVLMVLKMRQGAAAASGFNVRAGDVELSTSPRARVDV